MDLICFVCCFQLEDIIKFGLDRLFESDESSIESEDFTAILGPTVDGQWQQAETPPKTLVNLIIFFLVQRYYMWY